MRWSKLKQKIEDGFADSVRGRVEVWSTRYRTAHDQEGEGWITIDRTRVHSMGTLTHWIESWDLAERLRKERDCEDFRDPQKSAGYYAAQDEADRQMQDKGRIALYQFNAALFDYLNLSLDEILVSERMIIRALGMFDKRLGKRRLKGMDMSGEAELVRKFHDVRCALEGIRPAGTA